MGTDTAAPDMAYTDQSVDGLRLTLFEGEAVHDQLTVLDRVQRQVSWMMVDAAVIGASHCVVFDIGGTKLNEVFACTDVAIPAGSQRAYSGPLGTVSGEITLRYPRFIYQFVPRLLSSDDGNERLRAMRDRILRSQRQMRAIRFGARIQFPAADNQQPAPETLIEGVFTSSRCLRVETAHSYPNDRKVVFTETLVSKGAADEG